MHRTTKVFHSGKVRNAIVSYANNTVFNAKPPQIFPEEEQSRTGTVQMLIRLAHFVAAAVHDTKHHFWCSAMATDLWSKQMTAAAFLDLDTSLRNNNYAYIENLSIA